MDPLAPLIAALHGETRLRAWSLVITIFGDMVQHRGGSIPTGRLGHLMGRIGVEQGTVRTALSRLGRDGWVERERAGRSSLYRLSAQGLARFAPATSLIYAAPRSAPVTRWAFWQDAGGAARLGPADERPAEADCAVEGEIAALTDRYRAALLTPDHREALSALAADIAALPPLADPLDAAAARVLLVHRWRRLVLRHAEIPPELMPADAPLGHPRAAVARAYLALCPRAEAWLDSDADGLAPMPPPSPTAAPRFVTHRRA